MNRLRHCGAAYQAEILGAASGAEMADIEHWEKIVPLITCEIPFGQRVCELVFGVNVTDLRILGSKLTLSNNQSRATLWVRGTCLIVGILPLVIILIAASLSSKTYNIALEPECVVFGFLNRPSFKNQCTLKQRDPFWQPVPVLFRWFGLPCLKKALVLQR